MHMKLRRQVYPMHYTLRQQTNVKKMSFKQNKRYLKCTLFFSEAPSYHSFTFNSRFLYELKHKDSLSKSVCGIFHFRFRFRFVLVKVYILVQQKL